MTDNVRVRTVNRSDRSPLGALGLRRQETVMVHSSLGQAGYAVGGPVVVIRALLQVLTPQGDAC